MSTIDQAASGLAAATNAVGSASASSYSATKAVAPVAGAAAAVGGPVGATLGAIATAAASVYDTFKGILSGGISPAVTWEEANSISLPTATQIASNVINKMGASSIAAIFANYVAKLSTYISSSPHDPENRDETLSALQVEAVQMRPQFRLDAFPFDRPIDVQLAWAVYLHAMWLYRGSSKDEIPNGNALRKLNESFGPTLCAAISEVGGVEPPVIVGTGFGPGGAGAVTASSASQKSGMDTFTVVVLIGIAVGLLWATARNARAPK